MRIYIESTIPSYVVARPARDLLQAARQQTSKDWWELKRHQHELFTSQIVLDEIASGEAEMAKQRLETLAGIPVLRVNEEAEKLTLQILASGLLPAAADRDASHIALATVYEMDILLSWNCRHIANASIQARLRKLAEKSGLTLPVLCTPDELTGEIYED
jgi:predicted nucleic acid-binding protein